MKKRIYLDNNASTPLDPRVSAYLIEQLEFLNGNPSSTHAFGQEIRRRLLKARDSTAEFLAVKPQEIIFNSGATEGSNMVMRGLFGFHPSGHLITSQAEHACVYTTAKQLAQNGCYVTFLSPQPSGAISPNDVASSIRPDTRLIALMAVNNETGVKTDIEAIAAIAQSKQIPLLVDGVALLGKEAFTIPQGVSAMCFSGHKIHALQGAGFAFLRKNLKLSTQITGGEQELGRRGGTENILGILSIAKAIELLQTELPASTQKIIQLRERFERELKKYLPNLIVNGSEPRICNTSNLAFPGVDGESLLIKLDQQGLAASHGSACSSGALEPSRVLLSMGIPLNLARSSLRFSLSRFTNQDEIDEAILIIIKTIQEMMKC